MHPCSCIRKSIASRSREVILPLHSDLCEASSGVLCPPLWSPVQGKKRNYWKWSKGGSQIRLVNWRLKEQSRISLKKRGLKGNLINANKNLKKGSRGWYLSSFQRSSMSDRMRGNRINWKHRKFHLNLGKKILLSVTEHSNMMPRETILVQRYLKPAWMWSCEICSRVNLF